MYVSAYLSAFDHLTVAFSFGMKVPKLALLVEKANCMMINMLFVPNTISRQCRRVDDGNWHRLRERSAFKDLAAVFIQFFGFKPYEQNIAAFLDAPQEGRNHGRQDWHCLGDEVGVLMNTASPVSAASLTQIRYGDAAYPVQSE